MTQKPAPRRIRPTLKDKRREETRGKLIAAAKQLFSEYGYDSVPVTEIARQAGVTHSMINAYFGGKSGLLYEIVRENNAPQYDTTADIAAGDGTALDRLFAVLRSWMEQDAEDRRLLALMQSYSWIWPQDTEQENARDRARFKVILARLVSEHETASGTRSGLSAPQAAETILAIYTWSLRSLVFDAQSMEACHADLVAKVEALIVR